MVELNQNKGYEALDIHLARLSTSEAAWTGQLIKAQQTIQYHGNIVSKLSEKEHLSEDDQKLVDASWGEIARANKRQDISERRLQELKDERDQLLAIAAISKAKEFLRGDKPEVKETVDWVEKGYHYTYCTRCGETSDIQEFDIFLNDHSGCKQLY